MNRIKIRFYTVVAFAVFLMLAVHDWLEDYIGKWQAFAFVYAPFLIFSFFMNKFYKRSFDKDEL